jgi:ATP-binding cassette subfamily G (WHITE) protein 2
MRRAVITPSPADSVEDLKAKEARLMEHYVAPEVDLNAGQDRPLKPREQTPWLHQFKVLFRRTMKDQMRRRFLLYTQVANTILMAVLIGTAFLHIGTSETSTVRRQPVLFFCVINQGLFGSLLVINSFPQERMLVLRERAAGTYYVSAYFLAKSFAELVFQLIFPMLFTVVVYFIVGLHATASHFFIFGGFMVLCNVAATSLALMVSALCRTTDLSVAALPLVLEVSRLFGGFFLSPAHLPHYFVWLDALSYVKYTYVGIAINELRALHLYCTPEYLAEMGGVCPVTHGEQTMVTLGLDQYTMGGCAGILVLYIFFCRTVAFLGVRFIKW